MFEAYEELGNKFWTRFDELDKKMDRLSEKRGLDHSAVDVLPVPERAEWRQMKRQLDDADEKQEEIDERRFLASQRSLVLGHDDYPSDAAW